MADTTYPPNRGYHRASDGAFVVPDGASLIVESGGTLDVQAGSDANLNATLVIADGSIALADMADLAQDKFIVRTTASTGVPQTATVTAAARTVLDDTTVGAMVDTLGGAAASGTGGLARITSAVLVTPNIGTPSAGVLTSCTGLPTAGLVDEAVTTAKIDDGAVTSVKLANGAGLASLLTAGLGASISYLKTATGANELLADIAQDRAVLIVVVVDETFADGDTTQTTFAIGQTGTTDKFAATSVFTGATAGAVFVLAGTLSSGQDLLVTAVAAAGTGGISATVLALDSA